MPEYNGISEWLNQTLLEGTHALLHSSKLSKNLWGEAITHMVWLKNRTITRGLPEEKTPYKMLYDKKPSMSGLYEWGNNVWIHTPGGSKLDGCAKIGRWIDFDEISNGHRIYWPNKCSVTIERSIQIMNDNVVLLSKPIAKPIQGESGPENPQ